MEKVPSRSTVKRYVTDTQAVALDLPLITTDPIIARSELVKVLR